MTTLPSHHATPGHLATLDENRARAEIRGRKTTRMLAVAHRCAHSVVPGGLVADRVLPVDLDAAEVMVAALEAHGCQIVEVETPADLAVYAEFLASKGLVPAAAPGMCGRALRGRWSALGLSEARDIVTELAGHHAGIGGVEAGDRGW